MGTKMFHFPTFPPLALYIQAKATGHNSSQVPPFGHPRINVCFRLPEAYRRLPRPSSAPDAKASTDCSYKLTQHKKSNTKTLKINQRCSRPLYSSQTTTNPNPSNNQTVATQIGPAQKKPHTGASSEPQQRAPPPHPQTLNASASPVIGKSLLTFQPKQPIHTNSEHRLP